MQRGSPIDLRGVHVDALLEERSNTGFVALFGGVSKYRTLRRDGWSGKAEPQQYEPNRFSPVHVRLLFVNSEQRDRRGLRLSRCCPRMNPDERQRDRAA